HVTTVIPLTEEQRDRLRSKLNNLTRTEVQITNEVDPSILGGFIIKIDSQLIDGSVKFQLKKLREQLLAASK
ncbi:MAG: ATP synthase F1 subunit delta, partial [candidate division KSB1 bacterium]|nr:ATP synthase F1 subunit delta [candidate division KSB1 bacterium]